MYAECGPRASSPGAVWGGMALTGRGNFEGPTIFFVSTTIKDHERLFSTDAIRDEVAGMLFRVARNTDTALMAYCVMSSHIHAIAGHNDGGEGISRYMQSFKSLVSHMLFNERHGIWTARFDDVIIASEPVFLTKLNYVHENPVCAGLVEESTDWKWSSARFWYLDEPNEYLTKTTEWVALKGGPGRGRPGSTVREALR